MVSVRGLQGIAQRGQHGDISLVIFRAVIGDLYRSSCHGAMLSCTGDARAGMRIGDQLYSDAMAIRKPMAHTLGG
jgi:hypothetical protein